MLLEMQQKTVNLVLKFVGKEPISEPTEGTINERLEVLLDVYADKLIAKNPQYKRYKNNKIEIPEMIVMHLRDLISKHC